MPAEVRMMAGGPADDPARGAGAAAGPACSGGVRRAAAAGTVTADVMTLPSVLTNPASAGHREQRRVILMSTKLGPACWSAGRQAEADWTERAARRASDLPERLALCSRVA